MSSLGAPDDQPGMEGFPRVCRDQRNVSMVGFQTTRKQAIKQTNIRLVAFGSFYICIFAWPRQAPPFEHEFILNWLISRSCFQSLLALLFRPASSVLFQMIPLHSADES